MTKTEYYDITFNNVKLSTLIGFQGDKNDLSQLFNKNFVKTLDVGDFVNYEHNDIAFGFEISNVQTMTGFQILNNNITTNINGTDIKIGDNISLLGNNLLTISVNEGGISMKYALFKPEYEDSYISILFFANSGIIQKIEYVSPS